VHSGDLPGSGTVGIGFSILSVCLKCIDIEHFGLGLAKGSSVKGKLIC
jgi:hypothetical protein